MRDTDNHSAPRLSNERRRTGHPATIPGVALYFSTLPAQAVTYNQLRAHEAGTL